MQRRADIHFVGHGSSISVISEKFYKWLNHRSSVTLMPRSGSIRGITDQSANVNRVVHIEYRVNQ